MKIELDLASVIIGFLIGTAPFWLMATDLADNSELKSSGVGIIAIVAVKFIEMILQKKKKDKPQE